VGVLGEVEQPHRRLGAGHPAGRIPGVVGRVAGGLHLRAVPRRIVRVGRHRSPGIHRSQTIGPRPVVHGASLFLQVFEELGVYPRVLYLPRL
jgi:hypothetical protein